MNAPSPESNNSPKSSLNFSSSSENEDDDDDGVHFSQNPYRSRSLSNIHPDNYSRNEIHRIKERLLRTNHKLEKSTFKSFTRRQKMTLASLALVDFLSFCSMSIMAPFFPREASEKGLSESFTGFIFSFYALVIFLTSPIFGRILPKIGAKMMFLSGMFIAGVCNLLFATLEYVTNYTLFTTLCLLIRGFEALGASAFSTASYVFVVNTFPQNIGAVLGILETFVGLGMSTGPALGGVLYSLGGFSMPFFVLGIVMIVFLPLNVCLLPTVEECNVANRPPSIFRLLRVPTVLITALVITVVSSSWAFLDPTLEPHLRQFNLTAEKVGLIFLLFSGLYGISSPGWGWLADKLNNHWSMMVAGLFMCTIGLLLLGPCPYIPFLQSSLWLNLVSLSILGISVALALLPTFQGLLNSAIESGCGDTLSTYSVIAGIWSCVYSLGEVIGPSLGGFLLQHYGFPLTSTIMASMTLFLAVLTFVFFKCKSCFCKTENMGSSEFGDSWLNSDSTTPSESTPLFLSTLENNPKLYTEEKLQYYDKSRPLKIRDCDLRSSVTITPKGSCEI